MLKMFIDDEEVVSKNNFTIKEEILSPSSTILNNTYPKDWEETKDYISNFYMPKDFAKLNIQKFSLVPEIVGTTIQINGSATLTDVNTNYQSRVTKLLGQTSQSGTPTPTSPQPIHVVSGDNVLSICGKNLFDKNDTSKILNCLINGTTGAISNYTGCKTLYIPCQPNTTYTVSRTAGTRFTAGTTNSTPTAGLTCSDLTSNSSGSVITLTTNANAKYLCVFYYNSGSDTLTEEEIRNSIQIEKGSTALPYEPYIGQDYPIYLGVENLFDVSTITTQEVNGITITNNGDGSLTLDGTCTANFVVRSEPFELKEGTYTLSANNDFTSSDTGNYVSLRQGNSTTNISGTLTRFETLNTYSTFTTSTTQNVRFTIRVVSETIYDNVKIKPQIEKGSKPNHYTPYGTTPIELCKIGDYQDYIYKDNGNWYVHKEIGKDVLNGSENWSYASSGTKSIHYLSTLTGKIANRCGLYSNYFGYKGVGYTWQTIDDNQTAEEPNNSAIFIRDDNITSSNSFKTWLSTHNTIVYYVLATPTTTLITDSTLIEQLEALKSDEE